ncbi:restriction endonuclease subunit S [Providencia stuartii]|uniref:restriction endonuclease subunit S n=1 Tax=Providencia stuartii TaxID=588 RepID=UPI0034E5E04B
MMKISEMPKYDDYVDSGVEWLGRVPASWELTRLGTRFNERRSKVSDIDYPALSVTKKGVLPQLDNAAKTKDGDNRKLVKEGDFVINSRSDRKGSSGVSDRDGSVSLINIVLKPKGIHPKFSEHLLKSHAFIEEYYRVGRGIVADLWTTRYDEMRTITISVPSLEEQTRIANFLDKKTALIDEAISIKEKQINLLKERKQIIIQQAVTQGLDPNVPMKDSGVDWIGEIPEHWEVKALKFIAYMKSGETLSPDQFTETGFPAYGGNGLRGYTSTFTNDGDHILIGRQGALCGNVNYASGKFYASEHAIVVYPLNNEDTRWLGEAIRVADFNRLSQSAAQPGIAVNVIKNVLFPHPPLPEQAGISKHIVEAERNIHKSIEIFNLQIEKLKEYKTTLINSAVTGKIKITPEMVEQ